MLAIIRRVFFTLLLISLVSFIVLLWFWKSFLVSPLSVNKSQVFYVPPGSSIYSISQSLHSKGILAHPRLFILLTKLKGQEKKLKTGEYQLNPGITPSQLLIKLVKGKVILRQFTIIEGWTLKQIYASLAVNPYLSHTFNTTLPVNKGAYSLNTTLPSLEGTFYPDTYLFAAGISDAIILKKAYWNMQKSLNKLWLKRAQGLPYANPYAALIVASLIEKETARPEERAQVAGVILRRLQKNMRLQIDAAVIYGLGDEYKGKLTREDLKKETPYNTYLHAGLPPTPIAMPSLSSLQAALHPSAGNTLYYVAKGDGSHEFTATLAEHHLAVKKYQSNHLKLDLSPNTLFPVISWFNLITLKQLYLLAGTNKGGY